MSISVKFRILLGFGLVLLMLLMSAGVSSFLISRINNNVSEFSGALDRKFAAGDMDLAMTKVRVRVNQWLRSLNPDFAKQADQLLVQSGELVATVSAGTVTDTEKDNAAKVDRALKAYIESWHVIQGLYTDEAKLYADKIEAPTPKIPTNTKPKMFSGFHPARAGPISRTARNNPRSARSSTTPWSRSSATTRA